MFPRRITSLSLISPCLLLCPGRGWIWAASAKARARPGRGVWAQPTPPGHSWSGHQALSPGRGRKLRCLLLLTKEECSGGQNVSEGEAAKIISRIWEENQGVAEPHRRLGGPDNRWRQQASTSRAGEAAGLGGMRAPPGHPQCSGWAVGFVSLPGGHWLFRGSAGLRLFSPIP